MLPLLDVLESHSTEASDSIRSVEDSLGNGARRSWDEEGSELGVCVGVHSLRDIGSSVELVDEVQDVGGDGAEGKEKKRSAREGKKERGRGRERGEGGEIW